MKKIRYLFVLIGLCLASLCTQAQENTVRQIYQQAESEYEIGRIEQAIQLLQDNLSNFEGNLKQSAYRLLALCYLSEDRDPEARFFAEQLIKMNNYYNSTDDPARFQELISQLKEGIVTTITTASSQSETVNEAPVPITIITAEMINELGYNKNLAQILEAYVPGIVQVSSYDEGVNLSTHGAYANGQELILIMENGHRLNTRFDNNGPVSYSISTEKIDHIEVLRGPASSLYGNVALSAVVNIITKSGRKLNGINAKYGYASYNTHKADIQMGTQFMDADIFAWASFYNSDGHIRHMSDGKGFLLDYYVPIEDFGFEKRIYIGPDKVYVDGYRDSPAYDIGLTFKFKGFDLMFSKKNVKKVFQNIDTHGGYEYNRFFTIFGIKPGYGQESTHAELGYTKQLKNINLNASVYSDWYKTTRYDVLYDSLMTIDYMTNAEEIDSIIDYTNAVPDTTFSEGGLNCNHYEEHTMGGFLKASADYRLFNMKGSFLVGGQFEHFSLVSVFYFSGTNLEYVDDGYVGYEEIINAGKESNLSFFIQDKHYILPQLILNTGFRYDLKYRQKENVIRTFSPRLAVMYVPNDHFSLKLSYSQAFADLSFFYRYIISDEHTISDPQHISAVQLTAMGNVSPWHLNYEVNLFYNKYSNLLCWQERSFVAGKNAGKLNNVGVEATASYAFKRLSANLSAYYCHDISSEHYYFNSSKKLVTAVPHFTLNLNVGYLFLQKKNHQLKVIGRSYYLGKRLNYKFEEKDDFFTEENMYFDVGVKYRYKQRLQLSFDCENIFDTDRYVCGPKSLCIPMLQRGRCLMASVSYQL